MFIFRGSKSRNKVSVGEPAEGSIKWILRKKGDSTVFSMNEKTTQLNLRLTHKTHIIYFVEELNIESFVVILILKKERIGFWNGREEGKERERERKACTCTFTFKGSFKGSFGSHLHLHLLFHFHSFCFLLFLFHCFIKERERETIFLWLRLSSNSLFDLSSFIDFKASSKP